jgi:UDP-N-acetylmuramoyl-tripeptide--D-alanyl-D-alanine ligase
VSAVIAPRRGEATVRALVEAALGHASSDLTVVLAGATPVSAPMVLDIDEHAPFAGAITVGFSAVADYTASEVHTSAGGTSFRLRGRPVSLRLVGERHVVPALAAIAVAVQAGVDLETAIARVETVATVEPDNLGLVAVGGVLVIDDSFDTATRSSVEALKTIAEIAGESRRSIVVLGPLDAASDDPIEIRDEHDRLGRIVVRLNVGQLIVVGDGARHLSMAAGLEGSWDGESLLVATVDDAYDVLRAEIREGDVVLVKVAGLATRLIEALA